MANTALSRAFVGSITEADTLQNVFDRGQSITIANTDNQVFALTQNDTTNNPNGMTLTNSGIGNCLEIVQNGAGYGLKVDQNGNAPGIWIDGDSTDQSAMLVMQHGTAHGVNILLQDALQAANYGLYVQSNVAQTNATSAMIGIYNFAGSTNDSIFINHDGTGIGVNVKIDGVLAAGKSGLAVYSTAAQNTTNTGLVYFLGDNASNTVPVCLIQQTGAADNQVLKVGTSTTMTGIGVYIDNDGLGEGLRISHDNTSNTDPALDINNVTSGQAIDVDHTTTPLVLPLMTLTSTADNVTAAGPLLQLAQNGTSSTADCLYIDNDGTGCALYTHQNQNATQGAWYLYNNGTFHGIRLYQATALTAGYNTLNVTGAAVASASSLVLFNVGGSTATYPCLELQNSATSYTLWVRHTNASSTASSIFATNAGTGHGMDMEQTGVLASGKHGIYIRSSAAQVNADSDLLKVEQLSGSSTSRCVGILNEGSGETLYIDNNGTAAAFHIDTEQGNDTPIFYIDPPPLSGGAQTVGFWANDDVTGNVTLKFADWYLWVDSTGDLRISNGIPSSDTGGTVVGTQT